MAATAIGAALFALGRWYLRPALKTPEGTLLDEVLPDAEFNGQVAVVIHAPPNAIFQALREVTLADMPLAKFLGELRYLPGRLMGQQAQTPATEPFMNLVMAESGNVLLAEAPEQEVYKQSLKLTLQLYVLVVSVLAVAAIYEVLEAAFLIAWMS